MRSIFYLPILFLMLSVGMAWGQEGTIVTPANLATGVTTTGLTITINSTSVGADITPEILLIELSDNPTNFSAGPAYWQSLDIVRTETGSTNYNYLYDGAVLSSSTVYYLRVLSDNPGWPEGPVTSFTTASLPVAVNISCLLSIISVPANAYTSAPNLPASTLTVFPNARSLRLTLNRTIPNATKYVIQFDTVISFTSPVDSVEIDAGTNATAAILNYRVDVGLIRGFKFSGQPIFVRAIAKNSTSRGVWGAVRKYGAPLQPNKLERPTGTITRNAFKIWTNRTTGATRYYFQVSSNNFASFYSMTGGLASRNEAVSTGTGSSGNITGNVFRANYTVNTTTDRAFDYLGQLANNTVYSVRVRAYNAQQVGYWADTLTITPQPTLTASIRNPANNATSIPTGYTFTINDDPNFTESSFDFQVSTNAGFTGIIIDAPGLPTRSFFTSILAYNTTYFARVRSNVNSPALTSAWSSTVTFTTKASPTLAISVPTTNQVWTAKGTFAYSTWEAGVTTFGWEIQKTNLPAAANFTGTSTFYGRNFSSYVVNGGAYQIRVRGIVASQSLTGAYSAWVPFTVSPTASLPAAENQLEAYAATARLAQDAPAEPVAMPNPFTGTLMLNLPKEAVYYSVTALSGHVIEANKSALTAQAIGASWQPGLYLVQVQMASGRIRHLKVVKQ